MNNKLFTIFIVILSLVGIGLGLMIYRNNTVVQPEVAQNVPQQQSQPIVQETPVETQSQPTAQPTPDTRLTINNVELHTPGPNATKEEQDAFTKYVTDNAQAVSQFEIASCKPVPAILKVKDKGSITVKNSDSVDHTIIFNTDHQYTIPKNGQTVINIDFANGESIFGFGCETANGAVGALLIQY
jgi:hypothetical protein